jgi:hypothetical protein
MGFAALNPSYNATFWSERLFDDVDTMSAAPQIATECCGAVSRASGRLRPFEAPAIQCPCSAVLAVPRWLDIIGLL